MKCQEDGHRTTSKPERSDCGSHQGTAWPPWLLGLQSTITFLPSILPLGIFVFSLVKRPSHPMWMFSFTGWWSKPRMQQNFWLSFFFPPFLAMKYLPPLLPLRPRWQVYPLCLLDKGPTSVIHLGNSGGRDSSGYWLIVPRSYHSDDLRWAGAGSPGELSHRQVPSLLRLACISLFLLTLVLSYRSDRWTL